MTYALETWDDRIRTILTPEQRAFYSANPETVEQLITQSQTDRDKVRRQMIRQAFRLSKEKAMELFVQQHQSVLIRLLDMVHQHQQIPDLDEVTLHLYRNISSHLEEVLQFIEQYFTKYFNLDERVPISYLNLCKSEIRGQFPTCKRALEGRPDTDPRLAEIVCNYIKAFYSDGYQAYTNRDLIYHKELIKQICTLGTNGKTEHVYSGLNELLIYLNFNTPLFIDYFISQIHNELGQLPHPAEKMERLALHHKKIGQMQLKPGFALHSEFPSVRETLLEVLEREIEYLTTIKAKALATPPGTPIELPEGPQLREFVTVPFKGPEIYLLNKAFIDAGGAPNETYKSLLGKTGPCLANKNIRGFSTESLQKASDKVDPEAKDNVKRFLQRMIRNIDSYD